MFGAASSLCCGKKNVWVIVSVLAVGTFLLFLTYQKSNVNLLSFTGLTSYDSDNDRGEDLCFCSEASGNRSRSLSQNLTKAQTRLAPGDVTEASGPHESDTIVLIWFWPFGVPFELKPCSIYGISGCSLTSDRRFYSRAHGVLIHHRDINGDQSNLPQEPRPWFQKWVWWNMESPVFSNQYGKINSLFNATCGYRQDATVPVPYGYLVEIKEGDKKFEIPKKDKLVCWIVSHWSPSLKRIQVYNELKMFVNIEVYGRHFNKPLNYVGYNETMNSCKFYLSFENSLCQDYMSGKLWDALELGAVPVVMGPSRENYEELVPGDSFIHINDYPKMKDLAERLLYLETNQTEYNKYFEWTKRFRVKQTSFGHEHACRSCEYLRKNKAYHAIKNLNKWYWG